MGSVHKKTNGFNFAATLSQGTGDSGGGGASGKIAKSTTSLTLDDVPAANQGVATSLSILKEMQNGNIGGTAGTNASLRALKSAMPRSKAAPAPKKSLSSGGKKSSKAKEASEDDPDVNPIDEDSLMGQTYRNPSRDRGWMELHEKNIAKRKAEEATKFRICLIQLGQTENQHVQRRLQRAQLLTKIKPESVAKLDNDELIALWNQCTMALGSTLNVDKYEKGAVAVATAIEKVSVAFGPQFGITPLVGLADDLRNDEEFNVLTTRMALENIDVTTGTAFWDSVYYLPNALMNRYNKNQEIIQKTLNSIMISKEIQDEFADL